MRVREVIAAHTNTDFDAFAAMVAARKLYPEAVLSLGGAVNRNVREFQALYADLVPVVDPADIELDAVRRLILVDTTHANRLGELAPLCGRGDVQVVVFDHHGLDGPPPAFVAEANLLTAATGSLVTLMLRILAERGVPVTTVRGQPVRHRHPRGHRVADLLDHDAGRRRGARLLHASRRRPGAAREVAHERAQRAAAAHTGGRAASPARTSACPGSSSSSRRCARTSTSRV